MAVLHDLAVLVQVVSELRVSLSTNVELAPVGRPVVTGATEAPTGVIAVQVLAHQRRSVAVGLERCGEGVLLLTELLELAEASVAAAVLEDLGVVRVAAREDRCARRAAQRVGHEVVAEGHAVSLHP